VVAYDGAIMEIVQYPHPALRWKSRDVTRIDLALRETVRRMFDLMYAAKGIGLAANQVALPFRLFIVNLSGEQAEPEGELVFINPVITNRKGSAIGEEGCLSLPNLYADVRRAEDVVLEAYDLEGQPFRARLKELAARVVQHETDHVDGIVFLDRLEDSIRRELEPKVAEFELAFRQRQAAGEVPDDDTLRAELKRRADEQGG
jgi:peptide deformylase